MPLDLGEITSEIGTVDVYRELGYRKWAGELIVDYKLAPSTIDSSIPIQEAIDDGRYAESVDLTLEAFLALVVKWNLTDNGQPVPLTMDALHKVPSKLITDISTAIGLHNEGPNRQRARR